MTMPDPSLKQVWNRLSQSLIQDRLVQITIDDLRKHLNVDRVVVYYFYRKWEGRVTFESISGADYSIYGSTGPDECFNDKYAAMYEFGRVSAIENIAQAAITECHRNFLQQLQVRANLVVPILNEKGLWGLLIAHHCQCDRLWSEKDIQAMQKATLTLAESSSIKNRS